LEGGGREGGVGGNNWDFHSQLEGGRKSQHFPHRGGEEREEGKRKWSRGGRKLPASLCAEDRFNLN